MSAAPAVSVVTTFLDAERFLAEAIDSVRAQTSDSWELLLVDDGSSDGSAQIARARAAETPGRIRCLQHPGGANRGISASRNLGIAHARGRYLAFLDADDVYLPGKLEHQTRILDARPDVALTWSATVHWHSWTGRPEDAGRDQPKQLGVPADSLVQPPRMIPLFLRGAGQTPGTCALLVRRSAADAVGGFDDCFRGMFDDAVFIYKVCLAGSAYVSSGHFDRYRQHPDSHVRRMLSRGEYGIMGRPNPSYGRFLTWLESYLERIGEQDPDVWRALRRELAPYRSRLRWELADAGARLRWWRHVLRRKLAGRLRTE